VFISNDFGAFVFGREILKKKQFSEIEFYVKTKVDDLSKNSFCEKSFWNTSVELAIKESKFGRVGIFFDREEFEAKIFFTISNLEKFKKKYLPKNKRAEKNLQISIFETQILKKMANENWADSVEFRRIARKFIRYAKNSNIDTILFADAILGEEKACKILQKIAGSQIRCVFLKECLGEDFFQATDTKGSIKIKTGDELSFTKKIAEKILKKKIKDDDIQLFEN
jgi:hypothetical protein